MKNNKKQPTAIVPKTDDGMVGIRTSLNNMGISNESIGFDEKSQTVTLNGRAFMKPGYLDNKAGVSYANEKDIQKSLVDFYSNSSDPVVRVSDAYAREAGKYGLTADTLSYGNGTVSVGGSPLDVMYIDDEGKAWSRLSSVSDAVESYADAADVMAPQKLASLYENTYLSKAEKLMENIQDREEFDYDPEKDSVFQAYRSKYLLEGDRAARNSMANYSALTGGLMNSAAVTAGAQAQQYYAAQIANAIPDLANQAYERYSDKYKTDMNLLKEAVNMYDLAYNNAYEANKQQTDNANAVAKSNTDRDNAAYERYWNNLINNQDYSLNQQKYAQNERDSYWNEVLKEQELKTEKNKNQGIILDNDQKRIFLDYYEKILEADYDNTLADTELAKAQTYKAYYR